MIPLPRDFGEFLRLLSRHRVKYLVVGGYAVAYHGYPRYTGDIDIYVALSPRNAAGLVKVFRDFGFEENGPQAGAFTERGHIVRIGREPMRLEILNEIDGVVFDECFARRKRVRLDGLGVNFIGYDDLLKNKRQADRAKDRADVEELEKRWAASRRRQGGAR